MVHPSEILRSDSDEGNGFQAPSNVTRRAPIDCGIAALPCFTKWCNIEKFAKPSAFMCAISALGLLQGTIYAYYRGTANSWMQHYNFSPPIVDWLLYFNDIFIGLLAFLVGYWGNRIHRASWLGCLAIFQAISCVLLIIPEIYRSSYFTTDIAKEIPLCQRYADKSLANQEKELNYIALVLLYIYQFFYSATMVSLITHGLTYLDDNVKKKNSAAYLCIVLASFQMGKQLGMYSTWLTINSFLPNIFLTPTWLIFSFVLFLIGVIITMFPYELPSVVMRKMVESILVLANGEEEEQLEIYSEEFWTSFIRLITNKILMFNVYATLFLHAAIINFDILQSEYYKSRFFVFVSQDKSGYQDSWLVQIFTNIMKQPFVVLAIISTGMVIAKIRPSAKKIAIFNACTAASVLALFAIYGFLQCNDEIKVEYKDKLSMSPCNSDCACPVDATFYPVCVSEGQNTFYSPCHAGCSKMNEMHGFFEDCSCGQSFLRTTNTTAKTGSCNKNCNFVFAIAQINGISITTLIATTTITNLLINLRCVKKTDKAMSLALEAMVIGVLPYVPLRLIYAAFEDFFCIFYNNEGVCKLHSKHFGTFVTVTTIGFVAIAVALYIVVIYLIGDLKLYQEVKETYRESMSPPFQPKNENNLSPKHSPKNGDENKTSKENQQVELINSDTESVQIENEPVSMQSNKEENIHNGSLVEETSSRKNSVQDEPKEGKRPFSRRFMETDPLLGTQSEELRLQLKERFEKAAEKARQPHESSF